MNRRARKVPLLRPDGSFSIAARFESISGRVDEVRSAVARSIETRERREGVSFDAAFVSTPEVRLSDDTILVVFEGRPGGLMWKDWLVAVTRDVEISLDGVDFRGFFDMVAGTPTTP